MITHRGFTGVFEFEPEDSIFSGQVIDLADLIYFEGASVEELETSMARAVDQYLAVCEKRGDEPARPYTGQVRIRLESDLHRKLAAAAASSGTSLNSYIAATLKERVSR